MNRLLTMVLVIALLLIAYWVISVGVQRDLVARCYALQSQAERFALFYLTETEKAMCDEVGIIIDATVGAPE